MEWKRKMHKESTQRTKVAFGLFLPCIKKIYVYMYIYIYMWVCVWVYMCVCVTATRSPPNLYSKTSLPSEKSYRIQYITFCFTSLELQNKRAGNRNKFTKSTLNMILCGSTQKSENSWTAFFSFFLLWRPWQRNNNFPPCLIFTSPLSLRNEGPWRRIKGVILLSRFSSPPLVCLWWRQLWQE